MTTFRRAFAGSVMGLSMSALGCGASPAPAPETPSRFAIHEGIVPSRCSKDSEECLPPEPWVRQLCDDVYPEVALHLFRRGTPWQRLYMLASADATNASGGVSLLGETLEFGEEVIALQRHGNDRGFQVENTEGYDVLRWNGSCVTLHDGEFTRDAPTRTGHSRVEWRWLGDKMQAALKQDRRIARNHRARRHHCKGINFGDVTDQCVNYDRELIDSIVSYVRRSDTLPEPESYPKVDVQVSGDRRAQSK